MNKLKPFITTEFCRFVLNGGPKIGYETPFLCLGIFIACLMMRSSGGKSMNTTRLKMHATDQPSG